MSEESVPPATVVEVVESWKVPAEAPVATLIRRNILAAFSEPKDDSQPRFDDPQLVADLAVGPLVMAVGQLEVGLARAHRRIDELERALDASGDAAG